MPRLGVSPTLARTLRWTNCIKSMVSVCREHIGNGNAGKSGRCCCDGVRPGWSRPASSFAAVPSRLWHEVEGLPVAHFRDCDDTDRTVTWLFVRTALLDGHIKAVGRALS